MPPLHFNCSVVGVELEDAAQSGGVEENTVCQKLLRAHCVSAAADGNSFAAINCLLNRAL